MAKLSRSSPRLNQPHATMHLKSADRRALGAALLAGLLGALDLTVIATILPGMVTDLRINAADVDRYVWIVNSYLLAYVVAIPVVGQALRYVGRTLAFQARWHFFSSDPSSAQSRPTCQAWWWGGRFRAPAVERCCR